jgi:hypothetical protein
MSVLFSSLLFSWIYFTFKNKKRKIQRKRKEKASRIILKIQNLDLCHFGNKTWIHFRDFTIRIGNCRDILSEIVFFTDISRQKTVHSTFEDPALTAYRHCLDNHFSSFCKILYRMMSADSSMETMKITRNRMFNRERQIKHYKKNHG